MKSDWTNIYPLGWICRPQTSTKILIQISTIKQKYPPLSINIDKHPFIFSHIHKYPHTFTNQYLNVFTNIQKCPLISTNMYKYIYTLPKISTNIHKRPPNIHKININIQTHPQISENTRLPPPISTNIHFLSLNYLLSTIQILGKDNFAFNYI